MYEDKFKKKIKKLDSTLKYEGRILSVYQDKMQVGENIAYWDMVRVGNAATIIPVLDDGSIVMVRQYRPTMKVCGSKGVFLSSISSSVCLNRERSKSLTSRFLLTDTAHTTTRY